ncbi:hypothetical protein N7519_008455 [Penicillium mononematosum]|uniref:uncharacterized protein n=1 Tax=Penicillium mononematosum TaxID=268346 RepID=UPI002548F83B|nr:uncharacterized protein N7519_008455 [Penicillium mononematosum]KAJ6177994.1 hypothetical protein N7519_008455 [Penicillium mononematosum]
MRLFRAVQHFEGQSSVSTDALFQETQRQKPRSAPSAVFETLSGTQPLRLVFNDHTLSSRIPRRSSHVKEKHEDKKALHKRVTTLKETLEHKVKVEVGEGVLRQRR